MAKKDINLNQIRETLIGLLIPERSVFGVVISYSIVIGLLTLAVPIAVQTLINTIANIASPRAVTLLAIILFATLILSGVFSALRLRLMEYYERRVYARLVAEMSVRTILAPQSYFEGNQNSSLTHRYFDIMTLQKNIPAIMVDGVALVLQMVVGFTLVSFYHPFLLAFNLCVILSMWLIWRLWSTKAKLTAIKLSESKYETAKWLNNLAVANGFLKSSAQFNYAGKKTESYVANYTESHRNHFHYTFKQVVMFLLLYATASSALLGLGGWLVIHGQLSIGQLVAAELIMTGVFVGLSRFTRYLKLYYELYGSAEKIGGLLSLYQEVEHDNELCLYPQNGDLEFHNVVLKYNQETCFIDQKLESGQKYFVTTPSYWVQRTVIKLLKYYAVPYSGWILLDNHDLADFDSYQLRQNVFVLDRSSIIECSVKEYIQMSAPKAALSDINAAIEAVGLMDVINGLPNKMDTVLSTTGSPLQPVEFMLLKLVIVFLAKPKVLVINSYLDMLPPKARKQLLSMLEQTDITILYFTNAPLSGHLNGCLHFNTQNNKFEQTAETELGVNHE